VTKIMCTGPTARKRVLVRAGQAGTPHGGEAWLAGQRGSGERVRDNNFWPTRTGRPARLTMRLIIPSSPIVIDRGKRVGAQYNISP